VLGTCRSVEALDQAPVLKIKILEQRRSYCLASLQRNAKHP
jgi:hypothetical protein